MLDINSALSYLYLLVLLVQKAGTGKTVEVHPVDVLPITFSNKSI